MNGQPFEPILRTKVINYLKLNPIERGKHNCYVPAAKKFGITSEQVRGLYRWMRETKQVIEDKKINSKNKKRVFKENVLKGEADVEFITNKRIKTLDDLLQACEVDSEDWTVVSYEVNKWEVGRKDKTLDWNVKQGVVVDGKSHDTGKIFLEPLFQVKAKLSRRKVDTDLIKQKEAIIEELRHYSPKYLSKDFIKGLNDLKNTKKECLCELSLADHHFSKLSWKPESGEDYDIKIAEQRWKKAIKSLISRVNIDQIEKFLLPLGNDLFHIDNRNNTTTAGTFMDSDMRFFKMVKIVKRILVETIDDLLTIAPVDILIIPGNHDYHASLWIGEVLDAYYTNNQNVTIDSSPTTRKYYKYGKVGFQLSHGNEESVKDLGLIFAAEQKRLWADTDWHFCQLGHTHKSKKIDYISEDEYQGFQIQVMPSLCGTDSYHFKKGYKSNKAAKAFMYHKIEGKVAEFTFTHKEE